MTRGTIHAVDQNLYLVEGEWPEWPTVSLPGSAVLRSRDRLYLLDSGAGPWHRSAIRAVTASFGRPAELVLVNSGTHPGLVGNNDLLDRAPADKRRHLIPPGCRTRDFASYLTELPRTVPDEFGGALGEAPDESGSRAEWVRSVLAAYPPARPTSVTATDLGAGRDVPLTRIDGTPWSGWQLSDDLIAIEVKTRSGRLAFYLPKQRTVLLPDELALAPLWPGSDLADVVRIGLEVVELLDAGLIGVVGIGFGPPLDAASARRALWQLVDRARSFAVPATHARPPGVDAGPTAGIRSRSAHP